MALSLSKKFLILDIIATHFKVRVGERQEIKEIYPGHGAISKNPEQDLSQAILNAKKILHGEENFSVSPFRPPFESGLSVG